MVLNIVIENYFEDILSLGELELWQLWWDFSLLVAKDYKIIWQSFDNPTDTILGGQTVYAGGQLLSGFDQSDQSIRRFLLVMQSNGNIVSYPANNEKFGINAY